MKKILVYTSFLSQRKKYVFDWLFQQCWLIQYEICDNEIVFDNYEGVKINYSKFKLKDEIFILENDFINETNYTPFKININNKEADTLLFENICDMNCDIFSSIFYLLSRYEEYKCNNFDEHQRYKAADSIAFKYDFLQIPYLDILQNKFYTLLNNKFSFFTIQKQKAILEYTYDIDQAYLTKGLGILKSGLKKIKYNNFFKDFFDTYDYMYETNQAYNLPKTKYFILVAKQNSYNPNINPNSKALKELILKLKAIGEIGLHPGYYSGLDIDKLKTEKELLENILNEPVTINRMHYLKNEIPIVYQNINKLGFKKDYSMGYCESWGFRASTAYPFYWFDVENNCATELMLHPTILMEGTFALAMQLPLQDAEFQINEIIKNLAINNIPVTFIWHNHSISDIGFWKGYKNIHDNLPKIWNQNQP